MTLPPNIHLGVSPDRTAVGRATSNVTTSAASADGDVHVQLLQKPTAVTSPLSLFTQLAW